MKQDCVAVVLSELPFDLVDQDFTLPTNGILGFEKRAAFVVALGFDGFDLFLAFQLFLQCQRSDRSPAGFLELAVELLDFSFEADFEVIGPAVEFGGFGFVEEGVTFGDLALDFGLALSFNHREDREYRGRNTWFGPGKSFCVLCVLCG